MNQTIYTLERLRQAIADRPDRWRPLVLTNGCFDILHAGHVRYLQSAKNLGRSLVVGLNADASVSVLKPGRPIVPEDQRAEVLAALKPVDAAIVFAEKTATKLIATLQPDIYAKGGDWTPETLPEAPAVNAYGGKIVCVRVEIPTSTTAIVRRILATQKE